MTIRIAHLSDIHFGGEDKAAVEAAIGAVAGFDPTLTVVSGDVTLNGLPREFRAARAWLDRLPQPRLITPGNHDTPYWNLILRALTPFRRYRRYIGHAEISRFDAPGLAARSLNSARGAQPRPNWSKGAISTKTLQRIDWGAPAALKVFSCHHPLVDIAGAPVTGGVHRGAEHTFDISADLTELSRTAVAVVCAGPKALLDVPKTLEYLETLGVPVITAGSGRFPAFWSRDSGLATPIRLDSPAEIASFIRARAELGLPGGVLVNNPIPAASEIPSSEIRPAIEAALVEAGKAGISGKAVTPFLLDAILKQTGGRSLTANIALIRNNARLAAEIAVAMAG